MKVIIIGICWLLFIIPAYSQSFEKDMLAMETAYSGINDLYLEMDNSIWQDKVVVKEQNVKISKKGELYLYEMDDATMLINTEYILMIDHLSKTIIKDKWTKEKARALAQQHIPILEDIEKKYPLIVYAGEINNYKEYTLENKEIQLSKVEISFESKTGFMRKVRYYYNPNLVNKEVYTELKMNVINTKPSFKESDFSEKQFIAQEGKQFKGIGKYSNYTVQSTQ
jgi:hypothetical protein